MPYAMAKRGTECLVQGMAREGAPHGILVNGVRLGYIVGPDGSFELEGLEEFTYVARAEFQNPRDGELVTAEIVVPSEGDAPVTIVLVVP